MIFGCRPPLSHYHLSSFRILHPPKLPPFSLFAFSASAPMPDIKMESSTPSLMVLCGKSEAENDLAKSLKNNNALKLPGDDGFEVVLHSEVESGLGNEAFRVRDYFKCLSTATGLGRFLVYSPGLSSTQDVVSSNFCELPVGAVCVADVQFKGRGRSANVWESPKGSLLFSFTLQMVDGRMVPHVQYVVSLAMTEAINDLCKQFGASHLNVRIKWPNDLYLDGLKVGGILCTSTYKSQKFNVSAGFQPLEELYFKSWLHSGQRVTVQDVSEKQDQFVENVVTIQGLSPSGYLLGISDDGQTCELHPDGNRFDFFQGLVKRRLG
ncbi:unnamed protein product [Cuscuta europaea]|uniref:BPL/LPL catalytic domain-containing protein n=1 Tax=Cuscuta europaea TaxID=41803 RepID=A0A9P0Z145_CUSEU|nr:unnamed protein product [Cuscuta europaea]